jgi:hypothetical protein
MITSPFCTQAGQGSGLEKVPSRVTVRLLAVCFNHVLSQ